MKKLFLGLLIFLSFDLVAQIGGRTTFDFLNFNANARVAALGGENVSSSDWDPNMFLTNPANINAEQFQKVSVNYLPFQADIKKGDFSYVMPFRNFKGMGLGVQYINYGTFQERDDAGNDIGTFTANEYALTGGVAHQQGNISLGANLKLIGSHIQGYSAFAIATDIGANFKHPDNGFQAGLVFKNVGFMLKNYAENQQKTTPFDLQLGWSYKLDHMPLRFSMTAYNLHRWDIQYLDPTRDVSFDSEGEEVPNQKSFGQKLMRHFVFGGEFMLMEGFHLRAGYNFMRRQELKVEERRALAGFSFGGMIRLGWLEFSYSKVNYHISTGTNVITLTLDTSKLLKKKEVEVTEI